MLINKKNNVFFIGINKFRFCLRHISVILLILFFPIFNFGQQPYYNTKQATKKIVNKVPLTASDSIKKKNAKAYIEKYKYIAISEMLIHGIPASITLAQGLMETEYGVSPLCTQANNHFGIKCYNWKGKTFHYNDDLPNECFRKYDTPYDSYRDHSLFLRTRPWYSFLFELDRFDYKAWAKGLKRAGYATNPLYADGLIKRIEDYKLYEFDRYSSVPTDPNTLFPTLSNEIKEEQLAVEPEVQIVKEYLPCPDIDYFNKTVVGVSNRKICINNKCKYTIVKKGDTFYRLSKDFNIPLKKLYDYNDIKEGSILKAGDIIYLEKKRRKAEVDFHVVKKNQTMHDISQIYGIKLKLLYKRNYMKEGTQPKVGQRLWLKYYM
jgi:LysM repeat protein